MAAFSDPPFQSFHVAPFGGPESYTSLGTPQPHSLLQSLLICRHRCYSHIKTLQDFTSSPIVFCRLNGSFRMRTYTQGSAGTRQGRWGLSRGGSPSQWPSYYLTQEWIYVL